MDDFEFPPESWREQITEVTQTLSKLADFGKLSAVEFSKLHGEAMQRTIDTIRGSSEVLQHVFVFPQIQDIINRFVESQAAFNSEFFSRINQATVHFQSEMQKTWTVIGKATAEAMERTRSALAARGATR